MTKNIIIAALALVSILSLSFGYTQKLRADENRILAEQNAERAQQLEAMAQQQRIRAEEQARMAEAMMANAQRQLYEAQAAAKKK